MLSAFVSKSRYNKKKYFLINLSMFYRSKVKTLLNKTCNSEILLFNTVIFRKKTLKKIYIKINGQI